MSNLQSLYLTTSTCHNNQLTGFIPTFPSSLRWLDLSGNSGLIYPRATLTRFYDSTQGAGWTNRTGWLSESNPCTWSGIRCGDGCSSIQQQLSACPIREIRLPSNKLVGSFESEIWANELRELSTLDLREIAHLFNNSYLHVQSEKSNFRQTD
eukprot:TRINITY_DN2945_c0_g1_i2.p1 TRINITY_DN2945_c0_g1~~TRINITY_DN2945_c0_g1_i2.p1  ORF type:complete len:153 (+),score=17.41 TRINITY_DN2945_c0_g1_i2:126-584(+)